MDGGKGPVAPVVVESTESTDSTATLRVTGVTRYLSAAFLGLWLAGWAIGEVVGVGVLVVLIAAAIGVRTESFPPQSIEWFSDRGVCLLSSLSAGVGDLLVLRRVRRDQTTAA